MDPLRHDDPELFGAYRPVGRLDSEASEVPPPARRFIAQAPAGERTVVVTTPLAATAGEPEALRRFRAEADRARRLPAAPWLAPVTEAAPGGEPLPWYATPYLPALPLPAAVETHGGPLPPPTVYAIGAALAEALAALHAHGIAHAGLLPATVLLTGEGPRLTGLGTVGAAGAEGLPRTDLPGLPAACLPPEQAAGGRPRPLGDVYALGAALAYAAGGGLEASWQGGGGLPPGLGDLGELGELIARCLHHDAGARPTAADLLPHLVRAAGNPGAQRGPGAPGTVLDPAAHPAAHPAADPTTGPTPGRPTPGSAAELLLPGWLPAPVSAALARQSADVLAAETAPVPGLAPSPVAPPAPPALPGSTVPAAARGPRRSRRAVLAGLAGGVAGLAAGGAAAWAVTAPDAPPKPTRAELLADRSSTGKKQQRLPGTPPTVRWGRRLGRAPLGPPVIWADKAALITTKSGVTAFDLRTGEELWQQREVRPATAAQLAGDGLVLVPGAELTLLDAASGDVRWTSRKYRRSGGSPYARLLGLHGGTAAFTVRGKEDGESEVVGYDLARRRELWRSPAAAEVTAGLFFGDTLVLVPQAAETESYRAEPAQVTALGLADGEERWSQSYEDMAAGHWAAAGADVLVGTSGESMRGFDVGAEGAELWSLTAKKWEDYQENPLRFGPPAAQGDLVHALDTYRAVHTVDRSSGEVQWQRYPALATPGLVVEAPAPVVSPDGRRLVVGDDLQVLGYDADGGDLVWRFTDARPGKPKDSHRRKVAVGRNTVIVTSGGSVYALPLD